MKDLNFIWRPGLSRCLSVLFIALAGPCFAFGGEIHDAIIARNTEKVSTLLKGNPNLVFAMDKRGDTPLHIAAAMGLTNIALLLIANKAEVNARDPHGFTPLHAAALNEQKRAAEILLAYKSDINAKSEWGWTPLHLAEVAGQKSMARWLRSHGGRE